MFVRLCVCVCVWVRERNRDRECGRKKDLKIDKRVPHWHRESLLPHNCLLYSHKVSVKYGLIHRKCCKAQIFKHRDLQEIIHNLNRSSLRNNIAVFHFCYIFWNWEKKSNFNISWILCFLTSVKITNWNNIIWIPFQIYNWSKTRIYRNLNSLNFSVAGEVVGQQWVYVWTRERERERDRGRKMGSELEREWEREKRERERAV